MRHIRTKQSRGLFEVLHASRSVQAAMMTLRPGGVSDEEVSNEHPRSEQWVFVISGNGVARVGKRRVRLREHSLLLIEKGELHQITNTGQGLLRTINFYAPPAYAAKGEVRK
jgi:mannose-6-phosphate isomerase-like protein (cupin superfamily)